VVAGEAKGRRLVAPAGQTTRPTSDRVRESIFNVLTSLGAVEDAVVVDLFAGTGALGIEALSRGAAHATFVDDDPGALKLIKANLDVTGLAGRATVVGQDAPRWAAAAAPFDLALVDPPYAFDGWPDLLAGLPAGLAVLESGEEVPVGDRWRVLKIRRYGGTVVTVVEANGPVTAGPRAKGSV
jgi:16S rRNA (guanine966-N2)-methyltransferase